MQASGCSLMAACAALLGLLITSGAHAAAPSESAIEPAHERGFSYFMGLGRQAIHYRESASTVATVDSRVRTSSPVLVTGGLYALDERWLVSLGSETTFAAGRGTEAWTTDASVFNGVKLTDPVLQRNGFSLTTSRLQLLGHYRVQGAWFALAGASARSLSFKRFSFQQGVDKAVALPTARTVEESLSEVMAELGLAYESERVRHRAEHLGAKVTLGLPLWRRLENTNVPDLQFGRARGYDFTAEGRYSRQVYPHVHLGLFGQYQVLVRGSQTIGSAEMPKSRLGVLNVGIELLWKL